MNAAAQRARDELHPPGAEKPEASTRRRGAKRSGVRQSASEAGTRTTQWSLAPIRRLRAERATAERPN
jgi:hypothetical protein